MATPLVSAAAHLLFSAVPTASVQDVKSAILSSVDLVPALDGTSITGGKLNAARALTRLMGAPDPFIPTTTCEPTRMLLCA